MQQQFEPQGGFILTTAGGVVVLLFGILALAAVPALRARLQKQSVARAVFGVFLFGSLLVCALVYADGQSPRWALLCIFAVLSIVGGLIGLGKVTAGVRWEQQPASAWDSPRRCPTCGDPMPRGAPYGICPRCLLRQGFDSPPVGPAPQSSPPVARYQGGFTAPAPEALAPLFPQLEILELLGQGGMGAVYKARQKKLDRLVALKILPAEAGRDPAFTERFTREARALARLSHPNIVAVHDFGDTGDLYYFIMEYVDGVNLRQVLEAGPVAPAEALRLVPQLCDALQYAHEEEVVHRDIKPENILLDRKGRVKIADFGLAKLLGQASGPFTLTGSRQVMGTPHYMAPEQLERPGAVDHRADIYSMGVVLYEMLTGGLPLGRFALPSQRAVVDGRLDEVVLRALEKAPELRYQRVSEFKTDLEGSSRVCTPQVPAAVPSFQEQVDLELRRLQAFGPALGLIATGLFACIFWLLLGVREIHGEWSSLWRNQEVFWQPVVIEGSIGLVVLAAVVVLMVGGRRMMRLESFEFVTLASILAMLPWSLAWVVGLPSGIWALRVLHRPDVKLGFVRKSVLARQNAPVVAPPGGGAGRKLGSLLGGIRSLFLGSRVASPPPSLSGTGSSKV
jgi:tRNA A-37 threonylcarbamoyl transferase component Bud32